MGRKAGGPRGPLTPQDGEGRQAIAPGIAGATASAITGGCAAAAQKAQPPLASALPGLPGAVAGGEAMPAMPPQCSMAGAGAVLMTVERTTATLNIATAQSATTWSKGDRGRRRLTSEY